MRGPRAGSTDDEATASPKAGTKVDALCVVQPIKKGVRMKRFLTVISMASVFLMLSAPVALACGFLVSANGSVQLGKTTTFVAWDDGVERYITNFEFSGEVEIGAAALHPRTPRNV